MRVRIPHPGNAVDCPERIEVTTLERDMIWGREYLCCCPIDSWPVSLVKDEATDVIPVSAQILADVEHTVVRKETPMSQTRRDVGVAYILLLIGGLFGAHRYYAARTGSAVAMTVISLTVVGMIVTSVWVIVDLFLTAGLIAAYNDPSRTYQAPLESPVTADIPEGAHWTERTGRKA